MVKGCAVGRLLVITEFPFDERTRTATELGLTTVAPTLSLLASTK